MVDFLAGQPLLGFRNSDKDPVWVFVRVAEREEQLLA